MIDIGNYIDFFFTTPNIDNEGWFTAVQKEANGARLMI